MQKVWLGLLTTDRKYQYGYCIFSILYNIVFHSNYCHWMATFIKYCKNDITYYNDSYNVSLPRCLECHVYILCTRIPMPMLCTTVD